MTPKIIYLTCIGILAYVIWGLIVFFIDRTQMPEFSHFTFAICGGVVALVLRDMQPAVAPTTKKDELP